MKKINNFRFGFSITELLISMLVVMVVAAAMVPVIGPKKIKRFQAKYQHGLIICYSDGGRLYRYMAATDIPGMREDVTTAGYCELPSQPANKYELIIIGSGTDGRRDLERIGAYEHENRDPYTGYFRLDHWGDDWNILRDGSLGYNGTVYPAFTKIFPRIGKNNSPGTRDEMLSKLQDLFNDWVDELRKEYKTDMYAEFTNIRNPIEKAGGSFTRIIPIDYNTPTGSCASLCDFNYSEPNLLTMRQECRNLFVKDAAGNMLITDDQFLIQAQADAQNNLANAPVACWAPVYTLGGNSYNEIQSAANTSFLFPLRYRSTVTVNPGTSGRWSDDTSDDYTWGEQLHITTHNADGRNDISLYASMHGWNSTSSMNGDPGDGETDTFSITNSGILVRNTITNALTNYIATTSITHEQLANNPKINTRFALSNNHNEGQVPTENAITSQANINNCPPGRYCVRTGYFFHADNENRSGNIGFQGSVNGDRPAFTWTYPRSNEYQFNYGPGGNPGSVTSMILPKISGSLFLYPSTPQRQNSFVALAQNIDRAAYTASDGEQARNIQAISAPPDEQRPLLPAQYIIDEATPNNDKIINLAAKINTYQQYNFNNFRNPDVNPFYNCGLERPCPGFGGYGIYPVLYTNQAGYQLTITNNQPYAANNNRINSKSISFGDVHDPKKISCADGSTPKKASEIRGNNQEILINDNPETPMYYCTGAGNRPGAIVVLW